MNQIIMPQTFLLPPQASSGSYSLQGSDIALPVHTDCYDMFTSTGIGFSGIRAYKVSTLKVLQKPLVFIFKAQLKNELDNTNIYQSQTIIFQKEKNQFIGFGHFQRLLGSSLTSYCCGTEYYPTIDYILKKEDASSRFWENQDFFDESSKKFYFPLILIKRDFSINDPLSLYTFQYEVIYE